MLIECECLVKLPQQTDKLHHAPLRGVHFRSQHTLGRQCGETLFALGGNVEIHRCSEACEKAPRHLAESRRELLGGLDSLVWNSLQRSREEPVQRLRDKEISFRETVRIALCNAAGYEGALKGMSVHQKLKEHDCRRE